MPVRTLASLLLVSCTSMAQTATPYFAITVVDEDTKRGVPLVELRTVNNVRYYTDSAGVIAFHEPGLMDEEVYFFVSSHGYEYAADGFGYRGARLRTTPGSTTTLKIKRLNVAERLYRVTGGGIYRDSALLGWSVPIEHPQLNGLVIGQDSVSTTVYRGKIHWFWGDTSWPRYPLGNFQTAGAISRLPGKSGLAPATGVNLTYFMDERGFAKQMAPVPGEGPTWIDGVVTLRDAEGRERMFAVYAKVRSDMSARGRGFLEYDNDAAAFRRVGEFDVDAPVQPGGHTFLHEVDDVEYVYFTRPFPVVRVPAQPEKLIDISSYECFTCLRPGCTTESPVLDRDADGALHWDWKHDAPPLLPRKQEELIKSGLMGPTEARFRLHDIETGKPVIVHGGSVYWNAYRQRWIMIASEIFGTSMLGEVWLAEAQTPLGPWLYARKILTHEKYSFYNPKQHAMFDEDGGRRVYFEGTYSSMFSGNPDHTPRYDYNQIMYRLDLADPCAALPGPVSVTPDRFGANVGCAIDAEGIVMRTPPFLALDRPIPGCVAVFERRRPDGSSVLEAAPTPVDERGTHPIFYALPAQCESAPPTTLILYAITSADGRRFHSIESDAASEDDGRKPTPLCRVWRHPRPSRSTE